MDYKLGKFDFNPELAQKIIKSNVLLYCVVLLLALKIVMVLASINFPYNIFFADITKNALENFANQTRQSMGLPALIENQKLNEAAQMKAENMVQNNYFSHISPTGITPWYWFLQAKYNYKYAGENLAIGFYDSEEVYNAWLNSASHKANILNPNYKEVGTAVLKGFGSNNAIVVVQEFGSQQPVKPAVTQPKKTPVAKPNEPTPAVNPVADTNTGEKVLSQSTEIQSDNSVVPPNYDKLLQNVIYGVFFVVIGILIILIFFNFNGVSFKRELVFRSVLVIILLLSAALLNKALVISIIPHQIII